MKPRRSVTVLILLGAQAASVIELLVPNIAPPSWTVAETFAINFVLTGFFLFIREARYRWTEGQLSTKRYFASAPRGFLIDLLMPPDRAEDALYNILARYEYWVAKHGERKARLIFITQSIGAIVTFWSDWLLQRAKLLRLLRPSA